MRVHWRSEGKFVLITSEENARVYRVKYIDSIIKEEEKEIEEHKKCIEYHKKKLDIFNKVKNKEYNYIIQRRKN